MGGRELSSDQLLSMLSKALRKASDKCLRRPDEGDRAFHKRRSSAWVGSLAAEFRNCYEDPRVMVFSRDFSENQAFSNLNEFLYDILVCRVEETPAARARVKIPYVSEALWAVESELERNSRNVVADFSKLVMSSAHQKLVVTNVFHELSDIRRTLARPAAACSTDSIVYFCQIPHPATWDRADGCVILDVWEDGTWRCCSETDIS